ncbi:MAG: hypothetical protein KY445_02970 [Armatimonadetes bacterium]|nr:hypothetical protein [Armatimonadota bacterium]
MQISPFWRLAPLLIVAHALQTTWLSGPLGGWVRPDLPFLVALAGGLLGGFEIGAIAGVGAGLLSGLGAAWHAGSFLVSRAVPPALLGAVAARFSVFHPFAPPFCAFAATLFSDFLFMLISPADFPFSWWTSHALRSATAHALLIWPVFLLVARLVRSPQSALFSSNAT